MTLDEANDRLARWCDDIRIYADSRGYHVYMPGLDDSKYHIISCVRSCYRAYTWAKGFVKRPSAPSTT